MQVIKLEQTIPAIIADSCEAIAKLAALLKCPVESLSIIPIQLDNQVFLDLDFALLHLYYYLYKNVSLRMSIARHLFTKQAVTVIAVDKERN
ncbi:hypothetical protein T4D_725 [Trichinella pseudospiralis]|uniref:Uncharacterized protein n=1 Tax=Trichinella pseudospiralis TaxID=6337 RepID=A0A0V1FM06_TRIPS|nr:hypothetical protein T4D_725 [Trichinella pseudospiralis]